MVPLDRVVTVEAVREVAVVQTRQVEVLKEVDVGVREETLKTVEVREEVAVPVEVRRDVIKQVNVHTEKPVVHEVEVAREVPLEVRVPAEPVVVPIVKVVQVEAVSHHPSLYQRTAGGYKVWDHARNDINRELYHGVVDWSWARIALDARMRQRRLDELGIISMYERGTPWPNPVATGWGRWTESHRREIYGPVGDGRGQRHLPASSLEPGRPAFTSGVTPTPVVPRYNKVLGPHAFAPRRAPPGMERTRRQEAFFFARRAHEEAKAGGYVRVPEALPYALGWPTTSGHAGKSIRAERDAVASLGKASGGSGVG